MNKIFCHVRRLCLALAIMVLANLSYAADILVAPNSTFSFGGDLSASSMDNTGTWDIFSLPITVSTEVLPFSQQDRIYNGDNTAFYGINISSNFLPASDQLSLHLDIQVDGNVSGTWDTVSESHSQLSGSMVTFFELQDWANGTMVLDMDWAFLNSVNINHNILKIRGPLDADYTNQTGFIFEMEMSSPLEWYETTAFLDTTSSALVAGTYLVEISSDVSSDPTRDGLNGEVAGIEVYNDVTIAISETISAVACVPHVPCPFTADIDGQFGVQLADFVLWYDSRIDVTSDGQVTTADEAAMAYLLGVAMADTNNNGIVDAVDQYIALSPVSPSAVTPSVQLHAAYPNPFNPMTMLSFTLPAADTVNLAIYDVKGNRVRTLLSAEDRTQGFHEVTWNGQSDAGLPTPAGVYFYRLRTNESEQTGRMMLLK